MADETGIVQFVDLVTGDKITGIKTVDRPVDLVWNPSGTSLAILDYKTRLQLWHIPPFTP